MTTLREAARLQAAVRRHSASGPHARCTAKPGMCGCNCAACFTRKVKTGGNR